MPTWTDKEYKNGWYVHIATTDQCMDEFCYLGSVVTNSSSRDTEIKAHCGKSNSAFHLPSCMRNHKTFGFTLNYMNHRVQYSAETWSVTEVLGSISSHNDARLRKLLNVTRKQQDKTRGELHNCATHGCIDDRSNWGCLYCSRTDTGWRDIKQMHMTWQDVSGQSNMEEMDCLIWKSLECSGSSSSWIATSLISLSIFCFHWRSQKLEFNLILALLR